MSKHRLPGPAEIPPAVRRWIYRIAVAAAGLAVMYGILTIEESGGWLVLAGAILGGPSGLALGNVPAAD